MTQPEPQERSGVALMLAVAAVAAAVLAGVASFRSEAAFDAWQAANRTQVKHAAALVEDVRFVYADEGASALRAMEARIRAEELRAQAEEETGAVRAAVLREARAAEALAQVLTETGLELGLDRYRTPDGGFDIDRRLADVRDRFPGLVALDPDAAQARGNELGGRAALGMAATIPVGLAFLLGALAQAIPRRRAGLVIAGWGCIALAVVAGVVVAVR